MKNLIIVFALFSTVSFQSCSIEGNEGSCWVFSVTQTTTIKDPNNIYAGSNPQTTTSTVEKCELSSSEAKDFNNGLMGTTITNSSGKTITIKTTSTFRKK